MYHSNSILPFPVFIDLSLLTGSEQIRILLYIFSNFQILRYEFKTCVCIYCVYMYPTIYILNYQAGYKTGCN